MDIEQMAFERLRLGAETSKRMYNAPLLLPQVMLPPTRLMRYCCSVLKEKGGGETGLLRQVFAEPKAVHALSVEYTKISTAIRTKESF